MFSGFWSSSSGADPTAPNFFPVGSGVPANELFGELQPNDTEWLCAGGFVTETHTYYITTNDGKSVMCQVIHSAAGLWYPTIQLTCKIYDSKTGESIWRSINVNHFVTPPPGLDKRSSKADEFTITYRSNANNPSYPESYVIQANLGVDLQIFLELKRPATVPGFKVGRGPKGGYSYFGTDLAKPDGYVVHRFWPRVEAEGHIVHNGRAETCVGTGMFVHAIQGMRPNLVASAWNFAHFQSNERNGVSAIQMEFTTTDQYGAKGPGSGGVVVNVGSLVVENRLMTITAQVIWPGESEKATEADPVISKATHFNPEHDSDTGYGKPNVIKFEWKGMSLASDAPGEVSAHQTVDLGSVQQPKGLIEKVDVLAEIPYVIKMAVNYVAGTKPYIYQWSNPAKLMITGPAGISEGLETGIEVEGILYNEATFIS